MPPSGITRSGYLDLFPSPPTELSSPAANQQSPRTICDDSELEEERSWFYYLAEIAYRRMMDRALAIIGRSREQGWILNIDETFKQCESFNEQINVWYG
jgi:hypothetical protein